jgi:excisionase family DNA binding protein
MYPYTQTYNDRVMPDLINYVTTQEAATILGFHVHHVRRMVREGDLKAKKVGYMWFISRKSIEEYIEENADLGKFDRRRGNR